MTCGFETGFATPGPHLVLAGVADAFGRPWGRGRGPRPALRAGPGSASTIAVPAAAVGQAVATVVPFRWLTDGWGAPGGARIVLLTPARPAGMGADPNDPYAGRIADATATVALDDGRTLAYATFGDPDGSPALVFHGGIGSRGFGLLFEAAASELGVRVVSPDRPGYGRSDADPDRTLLGWADDVDALADSLDLEGFGVVGVSGGGPFAAACAGALPDRVTAAALVSSIGPPDGPRPVGLRVFTWLARLAPSLAGLPIRRQLRRARSDPASAIEARASGKADAEARLHRGDDGRRLNAQTAEAGRQGYRHAVREIELLGRPWGFDLGGIAVPVTVWHGGLDRTVPVAVAEFLARAIPDATLEVREAVGHLSLPATYDASILESVGDG